MITFNNTKTLYDLVRNIGNEYENRVFLRFEKDDAIFEKGYGTYSVDTLAVAAYIERQNKKAGHRIHGAILGKCSYEYLTVLLGVPCGGGVSIPMDVKLSVEKLAENLKKSDTDILFYDYEYSSQAELLKDMCPFIRRFICLQSKKNVRCVPMMHKVFRGEKIETKVDAQECGMIIFTSGTTGQGKGVMLSHGNLIDNMFCTDDDEEICLNILPIHHIFCISGDLLLVLRYGSTLCLCDDMSKMLYYLQLFQPTVIRIVPMMAKMLVNRTVVLQKKYPEKNLTQIRNEVFGKRLYRIASGGGYLSEPLLDALSNLGIVTGQGYGMSECSPKISVPEYGRRDKAASVGHLVTGCKARIVDGEIQVQSPSVMMGYYKEPELTKEAITEDGWLCTGDLGYIDEEGFIYLNGRKKNLIILSNGENVSPEMIENYFDEDRIVQDILVFGKGDVVAAEVYPNFEYAQINGIADIESTIGELVAKHNESLPSYARIADWSVRNTPFEKTSSNKIIRKVYFEEQTGIEKKKTNCRKAETKIQEKILAMVAEQIGNSDFGVDDNFYECGLDSLGSTILIADFAKELNVNITLSELMEHATVLGLEKIMQDKATDKKQQEQREVYPLTGMQKYFAYIIPGNTTGNLPYAFRLDTSIDLEKLRQAIGQVLDAHPALKAIVKPTEQKYYAIFRKDIRTIDIPIEEIKDADAEEKMQALVVPYKYSEDDNMVHIRLFKGEKYNYMFFDVAHFMGDGVTMHVLMEDLCNAYNGKDIEKESDTYTFYDYILDEQEREQNGIRARDIKYVKEQMKDIKLSRSILTKSVKEDLSIGKYGRIRQRFEKLPRKQVLYYGKKHGVSENAMFLSAFNYCIRLFSDEIKVFSNSIHSGRTDSRWNRLAGSLFETYYCTNERIPHEKVEDMLKKTSAGIMNTMKCLISCPRQGEMFFQFQGDLMETPQIGGKTERIPVKLDSLPFHLQVMYDDKGYYLELRYWENRFDKDCLEIFLTCFESILLAMLEETSVRCLAGHLPQKVYPKHYSVEAKALNDAADEMVIKEAEQDEEIKVYILDESYKKKPLGAWGPVYIMNYEPENSTEVLQYPYGEGVLYGTGLIGRIMPDGSIDFLEKSGRTVLTEGIRGRKYYDLALAEQMLNSIENVEKSFCYMCYDTEINEMSLAADICVKGKVVTDEIKEYMKEKSGERLVPKFINIIE